jgi:FKBP-type peptidyl-prolyl cis-trans isomerase
MVLTLLAATLAFQGGKLEKKDVVVGKGQAAKFADVVTVDYTGKLLSGKQFDSSVGRAPFTFVLGAGMVIKGWDQGVAGMKVGGKRKLKIPAGLAYGSRQMGPDIPPNSTLLFDVELKKIQRVDVKVLKKGTGAAAKGGDEVAIDYRGTLKSNGTEFDSSKGKQPIRFQLGGGVIPGFTAGVLGMKLGEKRRIGIPSELGYGERAVGPIPANSDLVFEIELVGLNGASK